LPIQTGDAEHTCADIGRARNLLNYSPCAAIETGKEKFVEWYKKSKN